MFFEASKRDDFERDITLRWTGAGEFLRDDRPINFKPGTELPIDHSLRAYCEILHDLTVPGRRKMQIEIMGQKVSHARPFEPYPKDVLGAVRTFLEPFRGHLSPKVIKIFEN